MPPIPGNPPEPVTAGACFGAAQYDVLILPTASAGGRNWRSAARTDLPFGRLEGGSRTDGKSSLRDYFPIPKAGQLSTVAAVCPKLARLHGVGERAYMLPVLNWMRAGGDSV